MSEYLVPDDLRMVANRLLIGDGSTLSESWMLIDRIARAEARVSELKAALAAVTEDRNAWRDEHNGDCPNEERVAELEAALERMRAPVSETEFDNYFLQDSRGRDCATVNGVNALITARAAALERGEDAEQGA